MKQAFSLLNFFRSLITPQPARDWAIALVILMFVFVGLVAYAGYLFIGIRWGVVTGEGYAERVPPPSVTRGELESALVAFRERRANFDSRNFGIPGVQDPSE